ncbi:MAG TPA: S1 RNA-binding domain-containing protein [Polyangiaceae bacterium]|nr:S1 RNA-binding domain-containing protein [Polyangiaceae bacterium]
MTVNDATPTPSIEAPDPAQSSVAETTAPSEPPVDESAEAEAASDSDAPAEGESDQSEEAEAGAADGETKSAEGAPKKKKRRRKKKRKDGDKPADASAHGGEKPAHKAHRPPTPFHVGEEVFGKVTAVLETAIMIDLSGKALAIFDRTEMAEDDLVPNVGDRFVARVHGDGARGGLVVLTRKPLREDETKPKIEQAHNEGSLVAGLITGVIKGGVEVDLGGLRAFAPASGMDLHPSNANFAALLGSRLDFKVVQYEKAGRDVVVTRRPMLEAEAHERRKQALGLLQEGQVMNGVVRTVVEWGVFVALPDAENLEGLVHVSEASHDPRAHLAELFKPGDRFEVKIVKIDERGKIWLSRKALVDDPWGAARQKYQTGSRHRGKVIRVERFGVFVELEPDIEGLIHVADLSLDRVEHPKELVQEGQEIDTVVHYFDVRNKKISLHPALPEGRDEPVQKVARNALIKAEVVKAEPAGLIVRVLGVTGRQARGFIPAGQTGTSRGTDLRKHFKPGAQLDVKVLDLDPRSGEPKLSISGFKDEEERRAHREYRQKLKAEAKFGTLGDLLRAKLGQSTSE